MFILGNILKRSEDNLSFQHPIDQNPRKMVQQRCLKNKQVILNFTLLILIYPIAIRKGTRTCTKKSLKTSKNHPISNYVSYQNLSQNRRAFTYKITNLFVPRNIKEALDDPNWKLEVLDELNALKKNETCEVVSLPHDKKKVGCKWVFTIKCKANGSVKRYKARLAAKGFTQTYGIDYQETFAQVAKLNSIRVLLSLVANFNWHLHQLDVKNAFLNGELEEEVFMSLPLGFEEN